MWRNFLKHMLAGGLSLLITLIIVLIAINSWYMRHFLPNTWVNNISIGNLSQSSAIEKLQKLKSPSDYLITLESETASLSASANELGISYNTKETVAKILEKQRHYSALKRLALITKSSHGKNIVSPQAQLDRKLVVDFVNQYAQKVNNPGEFPMAQLGISGEVSTLKIQPGKLGRVVDVATTTDKLLLLSSSTTKSATIEPLFKTDGMLLSDLESQEAYQVASSLVGKKIIFEDESLRKKIIFNDQELISVLAFPTGFNYIELSSLIEEKCAAHNQKPQNAVFKYSQNTLEVEEFKPDKPGISINQSLVQSQLEKDIKDIIAKSKSKPLKDGNKSSFIHQLPLTTIEPETTLEETNQLGINQLIGYGKSEYAHSIPSRIHNVQLATEKISNTIIPPGKEFSFNKTIGTVSRATGFKPAYIIKNGKTILGDGGGVCQVSTTLFRAALNAGLNITRRVPHSYRVGYYEQDAKPGIDATVYSGNTDLRFINDTPGYILIHGEADSENLKMYFEIYGTDDGRTTEIVDHFNWGSTPPPPPVYIEDPSLPPGAKKQIDWSASGLKAKFTNIVRSASGEIIRQQTFNSNYIPWSAKYLVGPNE